ncbi:cobalt transporter CbiM [Campylobacter gracilis]|uniref:Cobalt transport protein CbiM n=1 Tax=Campylobacter gracilis RM3268 TaxID=553220 RepID=C8PI13_9BACT|nr:cobalt transporter CbiM [Campylobacter gracilis]AKT93174.1 Co/Ni ABC transporter CbiKLMQO, membrane protein CbiM [Campylobacter gracilis]EEV17777.1 cobalt transport protein CbiM [Campylobacter gracilis RM3268]UEB44656.1 cobalt transporter CbiM [Campylobacter gracilis]SUW78494.1 cobalt transport protein CbiM [Campylobacter gracilis]
MHISEGVLSAPVLLAGWAVTAPAVAAILWRVRQSEIPRIACFSALFFVASFVHLPVGVSSMHLMLSGLVGAFLGSRAILAIFVALFLQGVFFGFGGLSVLGVNTAVIGFPAVLGGLLAAAAKAQELKVRTQKIYLFLAGFVPIVCSMLFLDLVLFISGREFFAIATLISLEGAILAVLEGIITLFALSFIAKFYGGQRR